MEDECVGGIPSPLDERREVEIADCVYGSGSGESCKRNECEVAEDGRGVSSCGWGEVRDKRCFVDH